MLSEEIVGSSEKVNKRTSKTQAQVTALENAYHEHRNPTEEMKVELAEKIGLTKKQITSWFCYRRTKDRRLRTESISSGLQDQCSTVIQDHASVPPQDSCGSTKHGDHGNVDLSSDGTSLESESALTDRLISKTKSSHGFQGCRLLEQDENVIPHMPKGLNSINYKPSGYLKVKTGLENSAITAVKRQLGRYHREDGPPLGVEFQQLPPGAFASPNKGLVDGSFYDVDVLHSNHIDESVIKRQSNLSTVSWFSIKCRNALRQSLVCGVHPSNP